MPQFDKASLEALARVLTEEYGVCTTRALDVAISDLQKRTANNIAKGQHFAFTKLIRGSAAMQGQAIVEQTREQDIAFCKALTPASGAGSYLVPVIQADQIIEMLSIGGVVRSTGCRIWPAGGIQKLNVPTALTAPSCAWATPNSQLTAADADIGQMSFDLKKQVALTVIPNELLRASVPAFDTLLGDLMAKAMAEHEDAALLATSDVTNGPKCFYATANLSKIYVNSSTSGGNISYGDVVACMAKAASVKAKGPFVWVMSPRTFYTRLLGMVDSSSRPIMVPTLTQGLSGGVNMNLMGYPVFVSPSISETETNSNGSSQSHLFFLNPGYWHVADGGGLSVQTSLERYFDLDQTAVRISRMLDAGVAPPQGCVILAGIN